jgi:hypothetical protein
VGPTRHDDGVDRQRAVPVERLAQAGQVTAEAGNLNADLGRCAPAGSLLHALVGVEGGEGTGVEDALGHHEGTGERLLHQHPPVRLRTNGHEMTHGVGQAHRIGDASHSGRPRADGCLT